MIANPEERNCRNREERKMKILNSQCFLASQYFRRIKLAPQGSAGDKPDGRKYKLISACPRESELGWWEEGASQNDG